MMDSNQAQIRKFIMQFFNDQDVRTLCFDYFPQVNDEFTSGMTKGQMVLTLVDYCQRHGRLPILMEALQKERPNAYSEQFSMSFRPVLLSRVQNSIKRNSRSFSTGIILILSGIAVAIFSHVVWVDTFGILGFVIGLGILLRNLFRNS